ncbi:hypothetical protein PT974_02195 [Cladobotryum mycophilum]|uniref:BTB domain-containing protein n=1 Tax=Cladobotryum mycophilum TaxID=491253 RepID=A0ABR0SXD7_9HYPO
MPGSVDSCDCGTPTRIERLSNSVSRSFNNAHLADVTIYLGNVKLPAHSLVLASQSDYFDRALKGQLKEGIKKEFKFTDGSMQGYWRVFEYMYTGAYSQGSTPCVDVPDDEELVKDLRVYSLADYFIIDGLKTLALEKFKRKIREALLDDAFVDCVRNVYDATHNSDEPIRKTVVKLCYRNARILWEKKGTLQGLFHEGGDFAVELMEMIVNPPKEPASC